MARRIGKARCTTSVTISPEFHELCRIHGIEFSEATRVGIALLLAEKGIKDYDNRLNITRRLSLLSKKLEDTSQELWDLKEKNGTKNA